MVRTGLMHMGRGERKSKHCVRDAGAMTLQIERSMSFSFAADATG